VVQWVNITEGSANLPGLSWIKCC